ncbi:beta strand repeat-containing protein, partial [Christiangramia aquimixticola]|uniref:beta strand repeat-containing protein n=2 Tax=Christiangramia TaxID=292691 RepID=UPI003AA7D829
INNGTTLSNTASVVTNEVPGPTSATANTTIDQNPLMTLVKDGTFNDTNKDGNADAGETISYTFTVTNTGNVTLTNIQVTDPKVTVSGGPISLAPGASDDKTFTATYTITQADVDAGEVVNIAVANSDETTGPNESNEEITDIDQSPNMELVKSGTYQDNGDGIVNAGDKIIYSFTVTNTGNVTLTNIQVTDPKVTVSGGPISLVPGASDNTTFTAEYILTQDDINAGEVVNTAVVTSNETTDPVNSNEETTDIDQSPNMELVKSGTYQDNGDGIVNAGDKIIYSFTVTNTGNVTLTNIQVTDPKVTVSGGPISLAPGASDNTTFTAEYILTQDDINAGEVVNTAVVTSDETTDPVNSNEETTDIDQNPNMELAKSGSYQDNGDGIVNAGDKIIYTFTVTNTGNVTLTNIQVTDPKVTVSGGPISLAPGASDNTTFTAEYILTQDDINAGEVVNTAVVTSDETTDPVNSNEETTEISQSPNMELVKSGTYQDNGDGIVNAGDKIIYTFTVTNTGNVTLTNIKVTDPKVTVSGGPISLAPGASDNTTFTAEYILTQDDINAGEVVNTAVVTSDETTDPVNSNEETTDIDQNPNMELAKSGSYQDNGDGIVNAGDKIIYTFTVTNTGNVTLTNIQVTDPKVTVSGGPISLAPGDSDNTNFTAEYILTQDDINAGEVVNTAVVTSDETTDPVNSNEETTEITQSPNMELVKSGSYQDNGDGIVNAGDKIIYSFTVTNTGNVTLTNIQVTDPKVTVSGGPISLAPGDSDNTTFTAEYILTQDDINAGEVVNTAMVISDETTDPINSNEETTEISQSPAIEAIKTVRVAGSKIGDVIEYDIVVTNTGNVTIENIEITDDNADTGSIQGSPILTLAPGDYVIVTAQQTITQAHIDAGFASNSATATGDSPSGTDDVSDVSDNGDPTDGDDNPTITDLDQDTQFAITKSTTTSNFKEVGDVIEYKLEVTNNGNTTIDNVVVTDFNADNVTYLSGDANLDGLLNVGETWTYKADHTVTSSDFSQGYVENTAEVAAKDPAETVINAISNTVRTGVLMVQSDEGSVNEDTSYTIDVLANDSYDPAATPKVTSVADPSNGSVVINSNGTITYTPNPDFNGVDSFEYGITVDNADGTTSEEINTMTVTILPVDDAVVDNAITSEDEEVVIDVLDNDTYDPATDVEVTSVTQPDNGTVVINPDGTVTYTPNPDYNRTDTFEYTATVTNADGSTTSETTSVNVNVEGTPDAVKDSATTSEDEAVVIHVLDNDTFDTNADVEVTSVTQPDNGTVVINPDGTVTYNPNPDYNGIDIFEYTATVTNADGSTTTETTTVTVNVEGTPDAVADNATTSEDEEVVIDVLDNDTYDPATDVEVTSVTQPDNGTVVIIPDGTVTYTPNPDYNGTDTFEYIATVTNADGSTTTETTTVTVNVEGTADAVADNATTSEDEAVVIDVLDNDTYDPATDVEVTSITQPDNGTVVINPDGTVTYTPNPDYNGTDTFEYTATVTNPDGSTTTETTTVTVNVEGTTDAVVDNATTSEDEEVVIDVLDNDTYDPATDVEVTSVTQPDNGSVVINPDGTVTYTPNPDYNGTDTFEYTATVTNADGSTTIETT